jgi:hypothetical protein
VQGSACANIAHVSKQLVEHSRPRLWLFVSVLSVQISGEICLSNFGDYQFWQFWQSGSRPLPLLYPSQIGVAFKHINRVHPRLARTLRCTLKVRQEIYPTDVMVKGEPLI